LTDCTGRHSVFTTVQHYLATKQVLLVLDNFEQEHSAVDATLSS